MASATLYDPPSGWRYGFPRPYEPLPGESLEQTLIRDGYPANAAADGAKHCRFIGDLSNLPANDNVPVAPQQERVGDWMQVYTGRRFFPLDPRPEEIFIEDVAHSLAMQCRYAGHCIRYYSVAEHSVLMARWLLEHYPPERALFGLLHDAAEAYLVDVPRPVKPFLPGYKEAEAKVMAAVCERFNLPPDMPYAVKEADDRILRDEMEQNMDEPPEPWNIPTVALGVTLRFWSPEEAEEEFLEAYWTLVGMRRAA